MLSIFYTANHSFIQRKITKLISFENINDLQCPRVALVSHRDIFPL